MAEQLPDSLVPDDAPSLEEPASAPMEVPANQTNVRDVKGDNAMVMGYVKEINAFLGDGARVARAFAVNDAWPVLPEREEMLERTYVGDQQAVEKLVERLEHRRILLLTGEPGCGKMTTALYLGTRVASRRKLERQVHEIQPLDAHVTIDIRNVVETWSSFGTSATVFRDAFSRRNRDLLGFFSRADALGWEHLAETLRARKGYLIFTATNSDVASFRQQLLSHIACETIVPVSEQLAPHALDKKVEWLRTKEPAKAAHFAAIEKDRQFVIEKFRTVAVISAFLDFFMGVEPDVSAAAQQYSDIRHWLVEVLPTDVDAWCSVVTLTLAQAVYDADSVPWLDYERLRRAFTEGIKADTEIFPRQRTPELQDATQSVERTTAQCMTDDDLFKRARIVIEKDADQLGDVVRFDKREVASEVWSLLLRHSRRVLSSLLPTLGTLTGDSRPPMRTLAAQIIGRLGEMDPRAITLPLIEQWGEGEAIQRSLIGRLLQGVFASNSDAYRSAALGALQTLANRPGDGARGRRLAAIGAYSHLGVYEPELAMLQLGSIALTRLVPVMDKVRELSRMIERVEQKLSTVNDIDSADQLLVHGLRLGKLAQKLSAPHAAMFMALERALVYLCLMNVRDDPVLILRLMRDWIALGGPAAGVLVSILFLHEDGIADDLEGFQVDSGGGSVSPIVKSLAASKEAVHQLCAFLADIHASINSTFTLPSEVQRDLRERFIACLMAWVRGAASSSIHREAVGDLFVALMTARGGVMREDILSMLGAPPFTDDEELRALAAGIRLRMINREEPCNSDLSAG